MRRFSRPCLIALAATCHVAVAAAGAKTTVSESATRDGPKGGPARKILVVAISPDPLLRTAFEDVIAGELSLRGPTAVPSYVAFPELPRERAPLEAKLAEDGFDAVLVSRLVGRDEKVKWEEGSVSYDPRYLGMDWWGGYVYTYDQVFIPGYLKRETRVRVRSDLWRTSAKGGALQWSGTSESLDPVTVPQAARGVGAAVAKALAKARLI